MWKSNGERYILAQLPLDKNSIPAYTTPRERRGVLFTSGRGAARLARYNGVVEVPGSNPGAPTKEAASRLPLSRSCQLLRSVLH